MITTRLTLAALAGLSLAAIAGSPQGGLMDYGRFLSASWDNMQGKNTLNGQGCTANKGIAIKLGNNEGAMLFDTDLCRWAGGWMGGYVNYVGVAFTGAHGPNPGPAKGASLFFETNPTPTWGHAGTFADPRKLPSGPGAAKVPFGPLPKDWVKYRGLFLSGDNVVVSYSVGTAMLLEMPAMEKVSDVNVLTRTTNVLAAGAASAEILWAGEGQVGEKDGALVVTQGDNRTIIAGIGLPMGAKFKVDGKAAILELPAFTAGAAFKVVYAKGAAADETKLIAAAKGAAKASDLRTFTKGGAPHWPEQLKTTMTAGTAGEKDAYVVDSIEVPFENPYKAWMRAGGFDFFKDGRIAVSTWSGDVWIVSGVNKDFSGQVTWKRYATGLFHALGLRIVNDEVFVLGRDQITKLHDLNKDGEADQYECFNNDVQVTPGFHEFTFDLQTDSKGNFYFAKGGPVSPGGRGWGPLSDHNGCIFKVSPDGQKFEIFATGVRAPNGMGVGPGDMVTTGDNEGTWVPKCYVHIVKPGDFISVPDLAHREQVPTDYGRHVCFIPKDWDNSGGGQTWVPNDKWGMPKGTMLHTSYGTCSLFRVVYEDVGGTPQGGLVRFPLRFDSGIMRPRFSPIDGQLYVVGLKGWQTSGAKDSALQRVRYTGKPNNQPAELHVRTNGIELAFPYALDAASASDAANYAVKQWNYKWTSNYGSDNYSVKDGSKGEDTVAIKSVKLSSDRKRVLLEIEGLVPVMQMEIKMKINSQDGTPVTDRILNTINVVPSGKTASN